MKEYDKHIAQLFALNIELEIALREEKLENSLTITNQMQFHIREINNYLYRFRPSIPY